MFEGTREQTIQALDSSQRPGVWCRDLWSSLLSTAEEAVVAFTQLATLVFCVQTITTIALARVVIAAYDQINFTFFTFFNSVNAWHECELNGFFVQIEGGIHRSSNSNASATACK
jgi:hypothetical protein